MKAERLGWSAAAAAVALTLLNGGCARLVTKDPETIAKLDDGRWTIKKTPKPAPPADGESAKQPQLEKDEDEDETDAAASDTLPASATVSAPPAAAPPEAAPIAPTLLFRERPEVARALRSPPDALGIPGGLYAADPLLTAYRKDMEAQSRARRAVGTGAIISGLFLGGLSAWAISSGNENIDSTNPDTRMSAAQTAAYGVIGAMLAVGQLIAGIAVSASSPDSRPLKTYYRETYVDPR